MAICVIDAIGELNFVHPALQSTWRGSGGRATHILRRTLPAGLAVVAVCGLVSLLYVINPLVGMVSLAGALALWVLVRNHFWSILAVYASISLGVLGLITSDSTLTVTKLLIALAAIIWLVRTLFYKETDAFIETLRNPAIHMSIVLTFIVYLSIFNAHDSGFAIYFFAKFASLCGVFYLVVLAIRTERQLYAVIRTVILCAAIVSLGGVYEMVTQRSVHRLFGREQYLAVGREGGGRLTSRHQSGYVAPTLETQKGAWVRVQSTFNDPNTFSAYLLSAIALSLAAFLGAEKRRDKWLYAAALLPLVLSLLGTGSRASLGLLGLVVLIYFLHLPFRNKFAAVAIAAGSLTVVISALVILMPQFRKGISIDAFRDDPRYGLWTMAIHMIADHPWMGVGYGNFIDLYSQYRVPGAPGLLQPMPHNSFLQIWAETGTLGAAAALGFVLLIVWQLWVVMRNTKDRKRWFTALALTGAVVGYFLNSLTIPMLDDQSLWLTAALGVAGTSVLRAGLASEQSRWGSSVSLAGESTSPAEDRGLAKSR
ncbi:MAG: O-antigen ligase family protein [Armatimonadetes bacterium]|nr:O-antigen ligase family protein [Armatimonadota bacterium]